MKPRWTYSIWMLVTYVALFVVWYAFPSRTLFLATGTLAVAGLIFGLVKAKRVGYFANPVDFRLHCLVIADVILETLSFEVFRLIQPFADVALFHRNTHFIGCASAFTLLIAIYRLFALRRAPSLQPEPEAPLLEPQA